MWKLPPNVAVVCPEENWYPPTVVGHRWYNVQQDTPASLVVIYFPRWTKLTQTLFKPAVVLFAIFLEPFFFVCVHFVPSSLCYFHWAALQADPAHKPKSGCTGARSSRKVFWGGWFVFILFSAMNGRESAKCLFPAKSGAQAKRSVLFPIWSVSGFNVVAARQGHFLLFFWSFTASQLRHKTNVPRPSKIILQSRPL